MPPKKKFRFTTKKTIKKLSTVGFIETGVKKDVVIQRKWSSSSWSEDDMARGKNIVANVSSFRKDASSDSSCKKIKKTENEVEQLYIDWTSSDGEKTKTGKQQKTIKADYVSSSSDESVNKKRGVKLLQTTYSLAYTNAEQLYADWTSSDGEQKMTSKQLNTMADYVSSSSDESVNKKCGVKPLKTSYSLADTNANWTSINEEVVAKKKRKVKIVDGDVPLPSTSITTVRSVSEARRQEYTLEKTRVDWTTSDEYSSLEKSHEEHDFYSSSSCVVSGLNHPSTPVRKLLQNAGDKAAGIVHGGSPALLEKIGDRTSEAGKHNRKRFFVSEAQPSTQSKEITSSSSTGVTYITAGVEKTMVLNNSKKNLKTKQASSNRIGKSNICRKQEAGNKSTHLNNKVKKKTTKRDIRERNGKTNSLEGKVNICYKETEVTALDKKGMPKQLSPETTHELTNNIFKKYHEAFIACAVCNQFVGISKSKLLPVSKLPRQMFTLLRAPDGSGNSTPSLHPILVKQYDVSGMFPGEPQFENLLLSPNGVVEHASTCTNPCSCRCVPHIYMCNESISLSCFSKLKLGKLPKLAIANGNWVGQLPVDLRKMSFGSRSLMRPVQTFGRITTFTGNTGPGGSSLKGHVYCTRLESAVVAKKVPIVPGQTPVRVLVVSPFTSDAAALYKGKIASTKLDYVIEPSKIRALHQFWCDVNNDVVKKITFDEETFANLPKGATSPDVFLVEKDCLDPVKEVIGEPRYTADNIVTTGGDSLLRSVDEERDANMISCTVTINDNSNDRNNVNEHEQLINLLPVASHQPSGNASKNTFVVRPGQEFVSDSIPNYLETLYPDLFPFGRGGFDEVRKVRISKKVLVAYYANLSTRQFQHVDFALPVYDFIARKASSNMARIRAYLPSRIANPDGSVPPRAEAYGRISNDDLKKAAEYQSQCVKSKLFGQRLPRPPKSLNGLATTFFTDQKIANQAIQHSQSAAQKNRQDVYAAHANNGKAHIWLTISPDDAKSYQVLWFALGPEESQPCADTIPLGSKRFNVLSNHPVAAALNFQRILNIVIENVIGWSLRDNQPYKHGGLFGVPKAWLRVVEEQSRLTLHTHMLIWMCGHGCIENQLDEALKFDVHRDLHDDEHFFKPTHHVDDITEKLADNIETFIQGELDLPEQEMNVILECDSCPGVKLKIISESRLEVMRKIGRESEYQILFCIECNKKTTVTEKLTATLKHGYTRLQKPMPSDEEIDSIIWRSLKQKPPLNSKDEIDLWMLDLACIQMRVNQHDWRHRKSCFKSGRIACRYGIPLSPTDKTVVKAIYDTGENAIDRNRSVEDGTRHISELLINIRKRAPFIFLTDCNLPLMSVLNCNNCTKYVKDQKVSMYYGAYSTKHNTDCEEALAEAMRAIERFSNRISKQHEEAGRAADNCQKPLEDNVDVAEISPHVSPRSDFSIGLGKLLSGVRASTKGDTIGGPLAAFVLLGNDIFAMSHKTEILPLSQALAYLEKENIYATITRFGEVKAIIHDYIFRSPQVQHIETMNFWNFIRTQEVCKLKSDADSDNSDSADETSDQRAARPIHRFSSGHPQYRTQGHRARTVTRWTKYLAKRLPDLHDLEESSNLLPEERDDRRTEYAKGVLTMFVPFREKTDLVSDDETWWQAYSRQKATLYADQDIKQTLDSIQNFYSSFCRSTPESEALDFSENDLQELVEEENEAVENNDEENDPINVEAEGTVEEEDDIDSDPFIRALHSLSYSPLDLLTRNWPPTVSHSSAKQAIDSLPTKKKNTFTLPGRASLDLPIEDSNPTAENPTLDTHLDRPLGTRIELLEHLANALDDHTHETISTDNTEPKILEQNFPSLREQSQHWTLSSEQHNAFLLLGAALLQHIYTTNQLTDLEVSQTMVTKIETIKSFLDALLPINHQLTLFLAGSGGTGKSRVIKCFKDFTRRWHSVASTVICASSGVAAMLIEGCTLHTALGIGVNANPPNPNSQHKKAWSEVGILLVDEFSMITPHMFDLMEERLRKLKEQLNKPFGGVHVIFCGDFYQLPPVGSGPIYSCQTGGTGRNSIRASNGRRYWKTCLTDVIELKQNHRQQDVVWSTALERFRINQPTQEDIRLVSSRFMLGDKSIGHPTKSTITAVPYNAMREKALRLCEQRLLDKLPDIANDDTNWRKQGVLLIQARVTPSRGTDKLTISQQNDVRKLGSKKLGCAGNLYCVVDAPYMIMTNSDVAKGVSNGTLALLKDIILKPSRIVAVTKLPSGKTVHSVCASDVECLLFQHKNAAWTKATLFPALPEGWFPVVATSKSVECRFNPTFRSKIHIHHFPCVLSLILTGHKVQGISTDSIILGSLGQKDRSGATGWLYVILSRVKTIKGLFLMENIEQNPSKYKNRNDVQQEMKRLRTIELDTLARLESAQSIHRHT